MRPEKARCPMAEPKEEKQRRQGRQRTEEGVKGEERSGGNTNLSKSTSPRMLVSLQGGLCGSQFWNEWCQEVGTI